MNHLRPKVIVILGMHRSGTSALCELISHLGAQLAAELLPTVDEVNSHGFFEDAEVVRINELILSNLGRTWFDLRLLPQDWLSTIDQSIYDSARAHIEKFYASYPITLLKDPRLCLLMPFWLEMFDQSGVETKCVYCYRHPGQVAASLNARDSIPIDSALLLWLNYTFASLTGAANREEIFTINYTDLLTDPVKEADRIADFVGLDSADSTDELLSSVDRRQQKNKDNRLILKSLASLEKYVESVSSYLLLGTGELPVLIEGWIDWHQTNKEWVLTLNDYLSQMVSINIQLHSLGHEYHYAQGVVNERDEQLVEQRNELAERDSTVLGRINRKLIYRGKP